MKTDYEIVRDYLRQCAIEIRGAWNGDEAGDQEDRAYAATELLEALDEVDKRVKELDI